MNKSEVEPVVGVEGSTRAFVREPGFQESFAGDIETPMSLRASERRLEDVSTLAGGDRDRFGRTVTDEQIIDAEKYRANHMGQFAGSVASGVFAFFGFNKVFIATGLFSTTLNGVTIAATGIFSWPILLSGILLLGAAGLVGKWAYERGKEKKRLLAKINSKD